MGPWPTEGRGVAITSGRAVEMTIEGRGNYWWEGRGETRGRGASPRPACVTRETGQGGTWAPFSLCEHPPRLAPLQLAGGRKKVTAWRGGRVRTLPPGLESGVCWKLLSAPCLPAPKDKGSHGDVTHPLCLPFPFDPAPLRRAEFLCVCLSLTKPPVTPRGQYLQTE